MTCCGKPLTRQGQQLVCRKCGAWYDAGAQQPPAGGR